MLYEYVCRLVAKTKAIPRHHTTRRVARHIIAHKKIAAGAAGTTWTLVCGYVVYKELGAGVELGAPPNSSTTTRELYVPTTAELLGNVPLLTPEIGGTNMNIPLLGFAPENAVPEPNIGAILLLAGLIFVLIIGRITPRR